VVTRPFTFEGKIRSKNALSGIEQLKQYVDTMIVVSNNMLLKIVDKHISIVQAFRESDTILIQTINGITGLINTPALINLDFADVTTIMKNRGMGYIGIGTGTGMNAAIKAVEAALVSPLLETDIRGASHVLLNFSGDIALLDVNEAASKVQSVLAPDAEVIFGADYNADFHEQVNATIIATGVTK
jgi:cell division protein FtsZ